MHATLNCLAIMITLHVYLWIKFGAI